MDVMEILSQALRAAIGLDAVVYGLAAIGLNLHFGYTGLLNFGQAAFVAVGAYGLATAVVTFGLPFWTGLLVGLLAAVALALLLGIPTLRLRADYLAIVTIAAAEIIRLTLRSVSLRDTFGGSDGLRGFSKPFLDMNPYPKGRHEFLGMAFTAPDLWILTVGWTLVALCCLLIWGLMRSPWGRVLKAIREDEDAARSLGKNVLSYKMQSLILGGIIGALAGFVIALGNANVNADIYSTDVTFFAYAIVLLGGAGRVFGPVLGAMIFWALLSLTDTILNTLVDNQTIGWLESYQVGQVRFMLVGLGLVLLMVFRPQGLLGDRRELALDAR